MVGTPYFVRRVMFDISCSFRWVAGVVLTLKFGRDEAGGVGLERGNCRNGKQVGSRSLVGTPYSLGG